MAESPSASISSGSLLGGWIGIWALEEGVEPSLATAHSCKLESGHVGSPVKPDCSWGGDWTHHALSTHRVEKVHVALSAHLPEAMKCSRYCEILLVIPIPGILAKVITHKMGKA